MVGVRRTISFVSRYLSALADVEPYTNVLSNTNDIIYHILSLKYVFISVCSSGSSLFLDSRIRRRNPLEKDTLCVPQVSLSLIETSSNKIDNNQVLVRLISYACSSQLDHSWVEFRSDKQLPKPEIGAGIWELCWLLTQRKGERDRGESTPCTRRQRSQHRTSNSANRGMGATILLCTSPECSQPPRPDPTHRHNQHQS